jgi:carbon-monoxide dehydrogenase small subunit
MPMKINISVNGIHKELMVEVGETLLEVLRNRLGLTGVKKGCGVGECGACTVLVDGLNVDSCIYLAVWADGRGIRTVEGLSDGDELNPTQQAFVDHGAVQCGFCTPGLIMTATAMVDNRNKLTRDEVRRELSGHLCRCTGYQNILTAVEAVLEE